MRARAPLLILALSLGWAAGGCNSSAPGPDAMTLRRSALLHEALAPALVAEGTPQQNYLRQIARRLADAASELHKERGTVSLGAASQSAWSAAEPPRVHMVWCDVPNVCSGGASHVYLYSELLKECRNEDELAAAVAHAYAHLCLRHAQKQPPDEEPSSPQDSARHMVQTPPSSIQEQEADDLAMMIFARAGWEPVRMAELYARLPDNAARAAALRGRALGLPPAARDWLSAPIADDRRFGERRQLGLAAPGQSIDPTAQRILVALPPCLSNEQSQRRQRAAAELLAVPVVQPGNPFEKGPRGKPR
jgi:hypothetical protein